MSADGVPATVGQRLLWMMDRYRSSSEFGVLNCPLVCRIRGRLDATALVGALQTLESRHETLRTTVRRDGRELLLHVCPARAAAPVWHDMSGHVDPLADAEAEIEAELRSRIDLAQWPCRVSIWRLGPTHHILCLNIHHVATDAWSTGVLFRELQELYGRGADEARLPAIAMTYSEVAAAEHRNMKAGDLDPDRDYWVRQLEGARLAGIPRRADPPPEGTPIDTGTQAVTLNASDAEALRDQAKNEGTTLFGVLLAGFFRQLHRTSGQTDITVASLFANRVDPRTHATVGFLANMVMLRCRDAGVEPTALTEQVRETTLGAVAHQRQPFQLLPPDLVATDGQRVDDVVFHMVTDIRHKGHVRGVEFELLVPEAIGSRFSFELAVAPIGAGLKMVLFYRRDWFADDWANAFLGDYANLLRR